MGVKLDSESYFAIMFLNFAYMALIFGSYNFLKNVNSFENTLKLFMRISYCCILIGPIVNMLTLILTIILLTEDNYLYLYGSFLGGNGFILLGFIIRIAFNEINYQ
jgi:hypothetical protein